MRKFKAKDEKEWRRGKPTFDVGKSVVYFNKTQNKTLKLT